jgi:HNH endonuclease
MAGSTRRNSAGVTSGNLGYALRAGMIAGVTALAFWEVGVETGHNPNPFTSPDQYIENVAGHALIGCASTAASGGKCGAGALAGAVTSAAGPIINGHGLGSLVANTVLGGLASVAGGGKFANGALTGAFGYLFNACGADPHGCLKYGFGIGATVGTYTVAVAGWTGIGTVVGAIDVLMGTTVGALGDAIGNAWAGTVVYNTNSNDDSGDSSRGSRTPSASTKAAADAAATDDEGKLRCFYCNGELTTESGYPNSREYDHRDPWSRGGDSSSDNIVDACRTCNRAKGAQTPWEFGGRQ